MYTVGQQKGTAHACAPRQLNEFQYEKFKQAIFDDYRYHLYIDGLPAAVIIRDPVSGKLHPDYDDGIPVGKLVNDPDSGELKYVLYNDWSLTVRTTEVEGSDRHVQIVGFEVEPRSYDPLSPITKEYRPHKPLYLDEL